MANVKVILRQDVPNLGQAGEVKQVAPGYFRNFLLPRGLAVEASKGQLRALETQKTRRTAQQTRAKDQMSALARQIEEVTLTIPVRLGEQGRIYGSVTNKDISEALTEQASISIDRHKIEHGEEARLRVDLVPEAVAE